MSFKIFIIIHLQLGETVLKNLSMVCYLAKLPGLYIGDFLPFSETTGKEFYQLYYLNSLEFRNYDYKTFPKYTHDQHRQEPNTRAMDE